MGKIATGLLLALLSAGPLTAGGHRYIYRGGHYYPPRLGFYGHYPPGPGYRYYGYSPSFTLGVYRPAAYANVGRCQWNRLSYGGRAYGASGSYPVVLSLPASSEVVRANFSDLIFNVTPPRAMVYIDGSLIGGAHSFATERDRFPILEGQHELRIEHHGYESFEATLEVTANHTLRIDVQLEPAAVGQSDN